MHHGLLHWLLLRLWCRSGCCGLCAHRVETPYTHVGVPFPVEFARRDFNLRLDALSRCEFLNLVDLVRPANQTDSARILFLSFDDEFLLAPGSTGAGSFSQVSKSNHFSSNFHCISYLKFQDLEFEAFKIRFAKLSIILVLASGFVCFSCFFGKTTFTK